MTAVKLLWKVAAYVKKARQLGFGTSESNNWFPRSFTHSILDCVHSANDAPNPLSVRSVEIFRELPDYGLH